MFHSNSGAGCAQFAKSSEVTPSPNAILIQSITLVDIFRKFDISLDSKFFIKMDCEGGERFAFVDENIDIFKHATQIAMEIHCANRHGYNRINPETCKNYLAQLQKTHNIIYTGRRGTMKCIIKKKDI